jgi:hypothetical protein
MIQGLTLDGLTHVLGHLRQHDQAEVAATIDQGELAATCKLIWMVPGPKWEARTVAGEPAVIGGFVPVWPGLGSGWLWGTDRWDEVVLEVTRAMRRHILPSLDAEGVHRIECRPMAGNAATIRWLQLVGFKQEAVTAQFGRGCEDFVLCARVTGHDASTKH